MAQKILCFIGLLFAVLAVVCGYSIEAIGSDSCAGRCNKSGTDPNYDCQCNGFCTTYKDCCNDYQSLCLGGGGVTPGVVTDAELAALTEQLLSLEGEDNAASYVAVDLQGKTSQGSTQDKAPSPLLSVNSAAYQRNTIALLIKLHDNYIANANSNEVVTAAEIAEENAFLDAVFATPLFQKAKAFLIAKGFLTESNFRATFYQIWFGLYSRGGLGSSGFEHVFLGELKSGVSGFHNWVYFSKEEAAGRLNYNGWLEYGTFGNKGSLIAHNFVWQNNLKPISSMFVGTSPELELSLFTVCWYARPNSRCTIQLDGTKFYVQTYDITYGGKKFVASSYCDVS